MAIFKKTEPGLLYELSPGRDGRLLVWSLGLMKYKDCTSLADMANINSNYLEQDIDDGCWFYQLPSLVNGDNMFYNDTMIELYEGRVSLWHFEANLQSLQSGVNMFKGCSLDAVSVKRIADTLPNTSTGTITLGIHCSLSADSSVVASLAKIESKGWAVETEYNLPYGFTELEYLESSGTQWIDTGIVLEVSSRVETKYIVHSTSHGIFGYRKATNKSGFGLTAVDTWMLYGDTSFNIPQDPREGTLKATGRRWILNDLLHQFGAQTFEEKGNCYIFTINTNGAATPLRMMKGQLFYFSASTSTKTINLIPALDASGKPCMYDKVNNTCFYNDGTGTFGYKIKRTGDEVAPATFSLRDPYYVAPSGVYARPSGENELDIVADTDMTEDIAEQEGYIWFANTGEAYDHFGITQQSEEGEVIDT